VLNTYLIWLRFQKVRGRLRVLEYAAETERVRAWLAERPEPHWREYSAAWARD
jgi:hypothetical protein